VGLGGVGKSQLAIEYAYRVAAEQPDTWVFWVHAGTQARVEEGFRAIADAVKLYGRNQPKADIPQLVYNWLSNERNGRWVMIMDSADDRDVFYSSSDNGGEQESERYRLPQSRNGSILVTTRSKKLARRLTGDGRNIIEIGPMVQGDALTLLEKKLGPLSEGDTAVELVRALDLVPLAISQAAAYIQAESPRISVEKYLGKFRESERKRIWLLGHDAGGLRRDGAASNAILTTWQISFDDIRSRRPSAADLLSLMSFFDRQGISEEFLKPCTDAQELDEGSRVSGELGDSESDESAGEAEDVFEDDVSMLRDYCLLTPNEEGNVFEMHGLVQLSMRKWLESHGKEEKFKHQFVSRVAALFPTGDYRNWATCQRLFPHVERAIDYRPAEAKLEEAWATLLYNGGWYAELQGRYDVAEQMASKSRRSRVKRLGKEDERTLASTSLCADVLRDKGRWEEAERLFVQVMETFKTKLGPDHPDTLTSMGNLASTYRNQGRWEEAEKLFGQVMETFKTKLGPDHPDTLTSMGNLALTYRNQGRWEEAERLEVQVMETRKTKLGADHPDTLTSMGNLASTYRDQGRWEEAEKLEVQVMETRKTKLGADHPDTLTSMGNLASTYWDQGRWEEAEKLFVQVMETRKTKFGADHPDTLTSMANLAFTWESQDRYEDALALMQDCVEARQRVLGPKHPDTLLSLATLSEWSS
jgi:tetratricopeptide (TPR) repeat protein